MALPLLAVAGGLQAVYSVGKAVDSYRFWTDYYRNTGYRPRYPFRAGAYDWMSSSLMGIYGIRKVI